MKIHLFALVLAVGTGLTAQAQTNAGKTTSNGKNFTMLIDQRGDTLYVAEELESVTFTSLRDFKSDEEFKRYRKFMSHAGKVYPYAQEAIAVFKQLNAETEEMRKGKRKRYAKKLQKDLDDKFEGPLKNLTKSQGQILVKMVEKELDTPLFDLIQTYRGGVTAGYWNTASKLWGYDLKHGYIMGEDPVLDAVLQSFDLSEADEK